MKTDRPYTSKEIFNELIKAVEEKGFMPDIIEYAQPSASWAKDVDITSDEWYLECTLQYGGSEGIYLDVYIQPCDGYTDGRIDIGTIKTLDDNREAMRTMAVLQADLMVECSEWQRVHSEDLLWKGYKICFDDSKCGWIVKDEERLKSLIEEHKKEAKTATITDYAKRTVDTITL